MCKCTPSIRTPYCGKLGCEWPKPPGTRERTDSEIIAAMGLRMMERPEISDEGRAALREKHRRNSPTHDKEIHGTMSDEWVANAVRMLMRNDLDHEAIVVAARDRIMRLSLEVERLNALLVNRKALELPPLIALTAAAPTMPTGDWGTFCSAHGFSKHTVNCAKCASEKLVKS